METRIFVLLATQRTGSSWVVDTLNSHADMKVYTEMFLREADGFPMWEPSDIEFANTYIEKRLRRPITLSKTYWTTKYLQRLFSQPQCEAVGFKYMYDQVRRSPVVLPYIRAHRGRVVHLIRGNLLDTVISAKHAQATGLYHLAGDARPAVPWWPSERTEQKITLDVEELVAEFRRITRERQMARAWLRLSRTPTCEVQYEQLVGDRSEFRRILEFLGLPPADAEHLHSGLEKVRTAPRYETVENFAEVKAALAGTPYASFVSA